jgi:hypothetical protein
MTLSRLFNLLNVDYKSCEDAKEVVVVFSERDVL